MGASDLASQRDVHCLQQRFVGKGLANARDNARVPGVLLNRFVEMGRDEHDGWHAGFAGKTVDQLESRHARHAKIQDDTCQRTDRRALEERGGRVKRDRPKAVRLENETHRLPHGRVIVHDGHEGTGRDSTCAVAEGLDVQSSSVDHSWSQP